MDLEHYRYTIALRTNNITYFIIYLSYALWFLNGHFSKKWNLEIDLLWVCKGGLNFKKSWLCSCVFLIKEGSQSYAELLFGIY